MYKFRLAKIVPAQPSHSFPRDLPLLSLQTFSIPLGLGALIYFSPLLSTAFVSLGDWSNGASRSALPEKPGKEIEDNPGFHAGDKLILEKERREGKCDVQAAFNQSRVSASLNNVRPVDLGRGSLWLKSGANFNHNRYHYQN